MKCGICGKVCENPADVGEEFYCQECWKKLKNFWEKLKNLLE